MSAYIRYTPAQYADGICTPRRSITGDELPSARDVSYLIHQGSEVEQPHLTTLLAFFGEFVSHDLVHNAQTVGHRGHRIKCCGLDENLQHPECFPINIKKMDPLFRDMKQVCMEYVRSCSAIRTGCTLGEREQINQVIVVTVQMCTIIFRNYEAMLMIIMRILLSVFLGDIISRWISYLWIF